VLSSERLRQAGIRNNAYSCMEYPRRLGRFAARKSFLIGMDDIAPARLPRRRGVGNGAATHRSVFKNGEEK
jgi:hypothetical protein